MNSLEPHLENFPIRSAIHAFELKFSIGPSVPEEAVGSDSTHQPREWIGIRAESADHLQVATFTRDLFSFSRLKPYLGWSHFTREAMRLWQAHKVVAGPSRIARLGTRFINRLAVPIQDIDFTRYFSGLGTPPIPMLIAGFLVRFDLVVPNSPYRVMAVRTFQPPEPKDPAHLNLLLDIDVSVSQEFDPDLGIIEEHLNSLRTLKNDAFLGSLTEHAKGMCR